MSTISDALKKAQQQRAIRNPDRWERKEPVSLEPSPPRIEPPEASPTPSVVGKVLVIVVVVLGVSVGMMRCGRGGGGEKGVEQRAKGEAQGVRNEHPTSNIQHPTSNIEGTKGQGVAGEKPTTGRSDTDGRRTVLSAVETVADMKRVEEAAIEETPLPPEPKLVGIFYSDKNPVAIINGFSLKEGETVGGYEVVKIQIESVTLKASGRKIVVRLK